MLNRKKSEKNNKTTEPHKRQTIIVNFHKSIVNYMAIPIHLYIQWQKKTETKRTNLCIPIIVHAVQIMIEVDESGWYSGFYGCMSTFEITETE